MRKKNSYLLELVMSEKNYFGRILTKGLKYGCLFAGVYELCKDHPSVGLACVFGVGCVIAEMAEDFLKESSNLKRLSILQGNLEELIQSEKAPAEKKSPEESP